MKQSNEQRYYDTLKRIADDYDKSKYLIRDANKRYGLAPVEVLEMSYDNIQAEAKKAIKGKKRPL